MICIYKTNSLRCPTEYIIKSVLNQNYSGQTIFVAPESSKASIERIVLDNVSKTAVKQSPDMLNVKTSFVRGDVVSFIKLAARINEMCGITIDGLGDTNVLRTALYTILSEHHSEFKTFGKFAGSFEYIDNLIDLLGDFTRYGIDSDHFAKAYEASLADQSDAVYNDKIHDLKLLSDYLYELETDYDMALLSNHISEANKLLVKLISDPSLFSKRRYREMNTYIHSRFVVIGFGALRLLTPQELMFIVNLNKLGAEFIFYPVTAEGISGTADSSVYYNGDKFTELLCSFAPDTIVNDYVLPLDGDADLAVASSNYAQKIVLDPSNVVRTSRINGISIANIDDRIGYIANEIIRLTRIDANKYRYRDIKIVAVDEALKDRLRSVFSRYNLASFIDRKILVSNTPVFRILSLVVELPIRYFLLEDILSLLRSGLMGVLKEDIDAFENYCVKYNVVDGRKLFDQDYFVTSGKYPMTLFRDGKEVMAAEYLWENVVNRVLIPVYNVATEISNAKLISEKADISAKFISTLASDVEALGKELIDRGDSERASALIRGYKEVMNLLISFTLPMNAVEISQRNFLSLIKIDMRNKSQGTIPLMVDSVDIVSPEQACITPCKVMFVIGANSENFPYKKSNEGLMTLDELSRLSADTQVELPDKFQATSRTEFITSALLVNSVQDMIYFVNEHGKSDSSVYNFFKDYMLETELVECYEDSAYDANKVEANHNYEDAHIDSDIVASIVGDSKTVSVSSLERYNSCHFKYMLQDILKINERDDNREIKTNSIGIIVHHMYQKYLEELNGTNLDAEGYKALSKELRDDVVKLNALAAKYFDDYCNTSILKSEKTEEFKILAGVKARRIFECSLPEILGEIGNSGYIPNRFEMDILKDGAGISYKKGDIEFKFNGFIDRVDQSDKTGEYRIMDYKTGEKEIKLGKTLAGVQIQLYAYANSIKNLGEVVDAGYYPIGLKSALGKDIELKPELAQLGKEDFATVLKYVDGIVEQSCEDISSGKADAVVNSMSSGAFIECKYCRFSSFCGNASGKKKKRVLGKLSDESISRAKPEDYINEMKKRMEE